MTDPDDIEDLILKEDTGDCVDDQVTMAYWFYNNDVTEPDDREKRTAEVIDAVDDRMEHEPETVIGNLVSIDVLERVSTSGSGTYIRNHRIGKNFYTPDQDGYLARLKEEITRLLLDIREEERAGNHEESQDDSTPTATLRTVAADAIGVTPDNLVYALTGTIEFISEVPEPDAEEEIELDNPVERMNGFDSAATAIIDHSEVKRDRDYEPMGWRNVANRYTLTRRAVAIEDNYSVSDFS